MTQLAFDDFKFLICDCVQKRLLIHRVGNAAKPRIRSHTGQHVRFHATTHHLATEQVDHRRQVQPAFVGGDVGGVAGPIAKSADSLI